MTQSQLKVALVVVAAFLAPAKNVVITTFILTIVDMITGILAARKRGEPITSSGLRRSISKIFIYQTVIICASLAQAYMVPELPAMALISSMVAVTELKSIIENLNVMSATNLLATLITSLGSSNDVSKAASDEMKKGPQA